MSRRVRVTAKRRREVDIDKLVFALLRILEAEQVHQPEQQTTEPFAEGGKASRNEEPAA